MPKRLYEPGEIVLDIKGMRGLVLSPSEFGKLRTKWGLQGRAGAFFAVGCCPVPDYITKIPVLFEDKSLSVMKPTGIKRVQDPSRDERLESLVSELLDCTLNDKEA